MSQKFKSMTAAQVRAKFRSSGYHCFTECVEPPAGYRILDATTPQNVAGVPCLLFLRRGWVEYTSWHKSFQYPNNVTIAFPAHLFEEPRYELHEDEGG